MQIATLSQRTKHSLRGFSLVELIVSMGIFTLLLGLVVANYRRGSEDSVLSRETTLLMSRLRFTQESTAGGQSTGYCKVQNPDKKCNTNADCVAPAANCSVNAPSGGYGMLFSCNPSVTAYSNPDNHWPGSGSYFMFADRVQCLGNCFPFDWSGATWDGAALAFKNMDTGTDHLFSSDAAVNYFKGDTIAEEFTLDPKVTLLDMQLLETGTNGKVKCINASPWIGAAPAHPLGNPPSNYPLQAVVHFPSPDGRSVVLSDNVRTVTPNTGFGLSGGQPWQEIQLMLGLKSRLTEDCRVVRITKENIITQVADADCLF